MTVVVSTGASKPRSLTLPDPTASCGDQNGDHWWVRVLASFGHILIIYLQAIPEKRSQQAKSGGASVGGRATQGRLKTKCHKMSLAVLVTFDTISEQKRDETKPTCDVIALWIAFVWPRLVEFGALKALDGLEATKSQRRLPKSVVRYANRLRDNLQAALNLDITKSPQQNAHTKKTFADILRLL